MTILTHPEGKWTASPVVPASLIYRHRPPVNPEKLNTDTEPSWCEAIRMEKR